MKQNNIVSKVEQPPKVQIKNDLAIAFLAFQKLKVSAGKDANNPFHKNKYATLESVIDACHEANQFGLIFYFETTVTENGGLIMTSVMEHAITKEKRMVSVPVFCKDKTNPQQLGGGITYAKRYSLQTLFCLPSEDDDGNEASGIGSKPSTDGIKTSNPLNK